MDVLTEAIKLAAQAHEGQVTKTGEPFILHPLRLMVRAGSIAAMVVTVLHDVPEDCSPFFALQAELLAEEVGELGALWAVTKDPEKTYMEQIRAIRALGGVALEVKTLDVEDHIAHATTLVTKGMVRTRYAKALRILRGEEE